MSEPPLTEPTASPSDIAEVLAHCQSALPGWRTLAVSDLDTAGPKGFSSFTMVVSPRPAVDPPGVLYRRLRGKQNAILDFETERAVYLCLANAGIAAPCLHYERDFRLEAQYHGRTVRREEVFDDDILRGVATQLHRFHRLEPPAGVPDAPFFDLLHARWAPLARRVLTDQRDAFPEDEQALCEPLLARLSDATRARVRRCLPSGPLRLCHNDTYHGNVMLLSDGSIRLLDFEFSCLGHPAFDFANFLAETTLRHGFEDPPHFRLAEPEFDRTLVERFVGHYLDYDTFPTAAARHAALQALSDDVERCVMLSDYMYALAAVPLAVHPIQKIRFLPYASRRFARFERTFAARFPDDA